jgi:Na+-driven multidrug efflux pump
LIFHTGFLVFAGLVGRLGDVAMTANQGLIAIESLGFMISYGFGIAGGALTAQKLGAGEVGNAGVVGWIATAMGAVVLGMIGLFFFLFAEPLVRSFVDSEETVRLGVECLIIAAVAQPFMGVTDALAGSLRGAGDTRSPMLVALVGPIAIRITGCWLLAFHLGWGLQGIWIATTADWIVRSVILCVIWNRGRWKTVVL